MKWLEVIITTNQMMAEEVSDMLISLGSNGVEMVDPDAFRQAMRQNAYLDYADEGFIEQYGEHVIVKGYFQDGRDPESLLGALREKMAETDVSDYAPGTMQAVIRDDTEWKDVWKEYYKPFELATGYIVKPSWEEYVVKPGETLLELDPGMAFGTGTHETTKMCAQFAAEIVRPGDKVIDIGCGTAILGILAAKSGAERVLAVDIDDAAVRTAKENALRNNVDTVVTVVHGILDDVAPEPFDVLLVNIIANVIIQLAPDFKKYMAEGAQIVLSGIIRDRQQDVIQAMEEQNFFLKEERTMGEWVAMVFHA